MRKNRVIEFEPKKRILEKSKKYIESPELFSEETDQAIPILLTALKHADKDLKREIMFVPGTFAKEGFLRPLYERDDRIFDLLLDRLSHARLEQKRSILFNLWRFHSTEEKVTEVYLKYLDHKDPELRFDALVCLRPITEAREHLDVYRKCLKDKDERIRELALRRLADEASDSALRSQRPEIEVLLDDPNMEVQKSRGEDPEKE